MFNCFTELSASYLEQGKFHEAYGLLKTLYETGPDVHFIRVLVRYYVTLLKTNRAEEADKIREELMVALQEKFADLDTDIQSYAYNLLSKKKHYEAALFYQVAIELASNAKPDLVKGPKLVQIYAVEFRFCIQKLLEENLSKKVIKEYFIPWYKKITKLASSVCSPNPKASSKVQAFCLERAAFSQISVGDLEGAEASITEGADLLKKYHGANAEKIGKYGEILGVLGLVYSLQNRPKDAAAKLKQGIDIIKKAEDYLSYQEKLADIEKFELLLKDLS